MCGNRSREEDGACLEADRRVGVCLESNFCWRVRPEKHMRALTREEVKVTRGQLNIPDGAVSNAGAVSRSSATSPACNVHPRPSSPIPHPGPPPLLAPGRAHPAAKTQLHCWRGAGLRTRDSEDDTDSLLRTQKVICPSRTGTARGPMSCQV